MCHTFREPNERVLPEPNKAEILILVLVRMYPAIRVTGTIGRAPVSPPRWELHISPGLVILIWCQYFLSFQIQVTLVFHTPFGTALQPVIMNPSEMPAVAVVLVTKARLASVSQMGLSQAIETPSLHQHSLLVVIHWHLPEECAQGKLLALTAEATFTTAVCPNSLLGPNLNG